MSDLKSEHLSFLPKTKQHPNPKFPTICLVPNFCLIPNLIIIPQKSKPPNIYFFTNACSKVIPKFDLHHSSNHHHFQHLSPPPPQPSHTEASTSTSHHLHPFIRPSIFLYFFETLYHYFIFAENIPRVNHFTSTYNFNP